MKDRIARKVYPSPPPANELDAREDVGICIINAAPGQEAAFETMRNLAYKVR